jgi:hypothetical protein
MFDFLRRSGGMRSPSAAMSRALEADGLPPGTHASALGVVESRGPYAGRKVTYFRAIDLVDPRRAAVDGVDLVTRCTYKDLDTHPELVLRAGFTERDGTIVINARVGSTRF